MTEQLMDDLTNEEHEALLLMSEHAIAPPLSPAARAVLNAAYALPLKNGQPNIAAALCAAADQVVPEQAEPVGDSHNEAREAQWLRIRYKLRAIAAELEAL